MAYSELVKNFSRIRDYMREFYVYGFKSRNEFTKKSGRSYDDEKRRLESWLKDYMQFRQTAEGKNVFLSIDTRITKHNPLYKAWKTKSFTEGDITLHFILMDILNSSDHPLSFNSIMEQIDEYLLDFEEPRFFDESTVRKKLNEYIREGIVVGEMCGKKKVYHAADPAPLLDADAVHFFSEVAPCGVMGSFLLDKLENHEDHLAFKHHYITDTMDSEILCDIFSAIHGKNEMMLKMMNRHKAQISENVVIPLKVMISVQNGRQYLMAYSFRFRRISAYRIDNIVAVQINEVSDRFDELRAKLEGMLPHIWGVSTQGGSNRRMEHVEFTIRYTEQEQHIPRRLEREKRCGTVEQLDSHFSRFSADVYDVSELIPWIRTFLCRITEFSFSNKTLEKQFKEDLEEMYKLYGLEEEENHAFQ